MQIPNDPAMLLSFINTQLRDNYQSFSELCSSLLLDSEQISHRLKQIDYYYKEETNQFQ